MDLKNMPKREPTLLDRLIESVEKLVEERKRKEEEKTRREEEKKRLVEEKKRRREEEKKRREEEKKRLAEEKKRLKEAKKSSKQPESRPRNILPQIGSTESSLERSEPTTTLQPYRIGYYVPVPSLIFSPWPPIPRQDAPQPQPISRPLTTLEKFYMSHQPRPSSSGGGGPPMHLPMMAQLPSNLSAHSSSANIQMPASSSISGSGHSSMVSNYGSMSMVTQHSSMSMHYSPQQHNLQLQQQIQMPGQLQVQGPGIQHSSLAPKGPVSLSYLPSNQVNLPPMEMIDENSSMSVHHMNSGEYAGDMGGNGGLSDNSQSNSQSEQRLKVEDALNYLDQVKYKFGNQPQVYNDFLDIMKEFKSQSIDTPGVITRVSNLFRGHPELIVGFNTFLPPGYKIEVSLSVVGQNHGYVVTTVQTAPPEDPPPPAPKVSAVQQLPTRPPAAHSSGSINGNTSREIRDGSSPVPTNLTVTGSNNFEAGPSPSFTHSFSSPFVASAFPTLQSQPVEFNHAINYVNKIKHRFHAYPDKYKQFLDILHTYQKEQRNIREGLPLSSKNLTEHEVYSQVSKLFENQEDLLQEFGQFLPDATNNQNTGIKTVIDQAKKSVKMNRDVQPPPVKPPPVPPKRPTLQPNPLQKKPKPVVQASPDIPLSEAEKYGTLNEFALFDKIRITMKSHPTYESFLRCLKLYNDEVINRMELINLVQPFLGKHAKLFSIFKGFLCTNKEDEFERIVPTGPMRTDKSTDDHVLEIDFATCKRLGASYCAIPNNHFPPMCSGRTDREKDVLNDVWVSFPTWSEDSTFVNSRKTQFEEYVYRCEDERFELDMVIETNSATVRVLEFALRKMAKMTPAEIKDFRLDDTLGGSSVTIYHRSIRRLYGDKATEIIEGIKNAPHLALPLVIKRLRAKEVEWREAQKSFNKVWREQMDKFYLKSLDHQGITFKQTDVRTLRPKALIAEIETLQEERQESLISHRTVHLGPHLSFQYGDRSVLNDACNLLLHHVRRQSGIQKEDKRRIKQILKHFIADLFSHERLELSDDEEEVPSDEQDSCKSPPAEYFSSGNRSRRNGNSKRGNKGEADKEVYTGPRQIITRADVSRRTLAKGKPSLYHKYVETRGLVLGSERSKLVRQMMEANESDCDLTLPQAQWSDERQREFEGYLWPELNLGQTIGDDFSPSANDKKQLINHADEDEAYVLFFANKSWYVFLRLHQLLCERLNKILETSKNLIMEEAKQQALSDGQIPAAVLLKLRPPRDLDTVDYYPTFLDMVRNLLDGNLEPSTYEDTLREMYGIHAYVAYTLDKVIINAVRQLQSLVTDELSLKCLDLHHQFNKIGGAGGPLVGRRNRLSTEITYRRKAELQCENDACTKVVFFKKQFRMTMELITSETQATAEFDEKTKRTYFLALVLHNNSREALKARIAMGMKPLFLERNKRCESRVYRRQHDYIAREYHQGDMPKYYCPKENDDEVKPVDLELDLLHNPHRYNYLYNKDIALNIVIPPSFTSIPSVVRNALIQKPTPSVSTHEIIKRKVALCKYSRFDAWHKKWCFDNVSNEEHRKVYDWFVSNENIERCGIHEPNQPPYRVFSKYINPKRQNAYSFGRIEAAGSSSIK